MGNASDKGRAVADCVAHGVFKGEGVNTALTFELVSDDDSKLFTLGELSF